MTNLEIQAEKLKNIRARLGLNRREFSEFMRIPVRSLEEWEAGRRKMPDYLLELIDYRANSEERDKKYLYAKNLEKQIKLDPLTKCKNRYALEWAYNGEYTNYASIGVVICDLNGLKKKNDEEGHIAGDKFICEAAAVLVDTFGAPTVYRIGGDEFAVVLLSVPEVTFNELIRSLHHNCKNRDISMSIGYKFTTDMSYSFEQLLSEADQYMYIEKRAYYKKAGIDRRSGSEMYRNAEYIDAMVDYGSLCYMALKISLTENTYEIIHVMEGYDLSFREECKSLEDFLYFPIKRGVINPDDAEEYKAYSDINYIRDLASKEHGRLDHWIRYRSRYNRDDYHAIEVQIFYGRDYTDDHQVGYLILKDMGDPYSSSRIIYDEIRKTLSSGFDSVFYVDFKQNILRPYRVSVELNELMRNKGSSSITYEEAINEFITESVSDKDKAYMYEICKPEFISEKFKTKNAFTYDFRIIKNDSEVYYRIKFANMGNFGELYHFVVGFENIHVDKVLNLNHNRITGGDKILLVEQSKSNREAIYEIFKDIYEVYEATNGIEAIELLSEHYEDIAVVITGIEMDGLDGFGLIENMNNDRRFSNIPVICVTSLEDEGVREQCVELGAADFITKPFRKNIILKRISSIIKFRGVKERLNRIEIDSVTGLYSKEAFYEYAQNYLDNNKDKNYSIMVSDVVGFRAINEQHGQDKANRVLKYISTAVVDNRLGCVMGGRIGVDILAFLIPQVSPEDLGEGNLIMRIMDNSPIPQLEIKCGIYQVANDRECGIHRMCDRAGMAMLSIKSEYNKFLAFYDDSMGQKKQMEHLIRKNMEAAIEQKQFEVYYQAKYSVKTEKIAGAEALVRWIHPELGFISPGIFIPIFEKNGFITRLDRYVWERVMDDIADWYKKGVEIPVSINVSRRDFLDPELATVITRMVDEHKIPHHLLHIEVTESAYSDNPQLLKNTVTTLHDQDFIIELDDFGTGYSSITALNNIAIDVMKLDLSMIRDDDATSDKNVLNFSMNLANMMKIKTIQEGVENREQFERVKSLGCNYVQGYYFAKPMPKADFEKKYVDVQ